MLTAASQLVPVSRTVYNYANAGGQSFTTREMHGNSIDYLDEQWKYTGASTETYYVEDWREGLSNTALQERYRYFYREYNRLFAQGERYAYGKALQIAAVSWNRAHTELLPPNRRRVANDYFSNSSGPIRAAQEALGNDELGSQIVFEAATLGVGLIGSAEAAAAKGGVDIVGTNFNKVLPTQDYINPLKVAEYKTLIKSGVKVPASEAYQVGGKIFLEEGHHRFVANMQLGIKPPLIIRNTGGPVGFPNWSNTTYQIPPLGY